MAPPSGLESRRSVGRPAGDPAAAAAARDPRPGLELPSKSIRLHFESSAVRAAAGRPAAPAGAAVGRWGGEDGGLGLLAGGAAAATAATALAEAASAAPAAAPPAGASAAGGGLQAP